MGDVAVTVYCATTNPGKLREIRAAAAAFGPPGVHLEPLPGLSTLAPPEEVGETFADNAIAKALYYGRYTTHYVLAEDSGLEVEALGGAPGVHSARYAGEGARDEDNNRLLLERLAGVTNRRARYVCVAALAREGRVWGVFKGRVEGEILTAPRGSGGFGYDPLFYYPPFGATFGECPLEEKQKVSHRAEALKQLFTFLRTQSSGC